MLRARWVAINEPFETSANVAFDLTAIRSALEERHARVARAIIRLERASRISARVADVRAER
jgi:hypothetical protein